MSRVRCAQFSMTNWSSDRFFFFFFFNDTAPTEFYPLSLHDALPIFPPLVCLVMSRSAWWTVSRLLAQICSMRSPWHQAGSRASSGKDGMLTRRRPRPGLVPRRSEEHTSELQSRLHLVCRLLLEKKKK